MDMEIKLSHPSVQDLLAIAHAHIQSHPRDLDLKSAEVIAGEEVHQETGMRLVTRMMNPLHKFT
jgi:hypothetical protein